MPYCTAHVVVIDPTDRKEHINGFLHSDTNSLMARLCDLAPGQNTVLSYLDVWYPLGTDKETIAGEIQGCQVGLVDGSHVIPFKIPCKHDITVGFGCTVQSYRDGNHIHQFKRLSDRVLELIANPAHYAEQETKKPITINIIHQGGRITYALARESLEDLRKLHGHRWITKSVSMDIDSVPDIEMLRGSIKADIVSMVTDIPLGHISRYGGVRFVNAGNDETIWQYP